MGETICYSPGVAMSLPIDLNLKQFCNQYGIKYYRAKTRLEDNPEDKKVVFPVLHENEIQARNGKDIAPRKITIVPLETAPLIYAYLRAEEGKDPIAAQREYLETLRNENEYYFSVCRDSDPYFQRLYIDLLCMDPLAERLSMIYTLSQMGLPKKRAKMLLDCLGDLEGLICRLQESYFPNGYKKPREVVFDHKTGAPFDRLYRKLSAHRPSARQRDLVLAQADSLFEQKEQARNLKEALLAVPPRRTTANACEQEKREYAKKQYMEWLKTGLNKKEKTIAKNFSEQAIRLEVYLRTPVSNADQKVHRTLSTNLYRFAHRLLKDEIVTEQPNSRTLDLNTLPPEALFLDRATKEATLEIMKTAIPYISLSNALQGVVNMTEYIKKLDSLLVSGEEATAILLAGTNKIVAATISRLPTMLKTAGFQKTSDDQLGYIRKHPIEAAAELKSLFLGYREDCQLFDTLSGCIACQLYQDCPYSKYAELDEERLQYMTQAIATRNPATVLSGLSELALLYSVLTSITVCRVAEYEAINLTRTWENHRKSNKLLLKYLKNMNFIDSNIKNI